MNNKTESKKTTIDKFNSSYIIKKGRVVINNNKRDVIKIVFNSQDTPLNSGVHYFNLVDTSWSMHYDEAILKKTLKEFSRGLSENDKLTLITFNSPYNARLIVSSESLLDFANFELHDTLIDNLVLDGCTCFSSPLELANQLIRHCEPSDYLCVSMVTDGNIEGVDNVSTEKELCNIYAERLSEKVMAINTIGIGGDCDGDFLRNLSNKSLFGKYEHIDNISDMGSRLRNTLNEMIRYSKSDLKIEANGKILYQNEFKQLLSNDVLDLNYMNKDNNVVYVLLDENENTFKINDVDYTIEEIEKNVNDYDMYNFIEDIQTEIKYQEETSQELDTIELDDVVVVEEDKANKSDSSHLKYDNLLDLLENIKDRAFIDIETFKNYQSCNQSIKEDNVKYKNTYFSRFNDYSINVKGTNLNVAFKHRVELDIDKNDLKTVKLDNVLPNKLELNTIKHYSIVKDGEYNIDTLVIHVHDDVYYEIVNSLVASHNLWDFIKSASKSSIDNYVLLKIDVSKLAIIDSDLEFDNRFSSIYYDFLDLTRHKAIAKVLKHYINSYRGVFVNEFKDLDTNQVDMFKRYNIDSNLLYTPKSKRKTPKSNNGISFSLRGERTLPTVKSIKDLYDKRLTATNHCDSAMYEVLHDCEYDMQTKTVEECLDIWNNLLDISNSRIAELEKFINLEKFKRFVSNNYWNVEDTYGEYPTCNITINRKGGAY